LKKNDAGRSSRSKNHEDRSEYAVGDRDKFEVRIEDVGSVPIKIPFSPHLAALRPGDASQKFGYSDVAFPIVDRRREMDHE